MIRFLALLALALPLAAAPASPAPAGAPHARAVRAPAAAAAPHDPVAADAAAALAELEQDGRDVRALAVVARLAELEDDVPDLGPIAAAYARVAEDRGAHPEVQAAARWQLARIERARGNLNRSDAHAGELGFVSGWWVIGPFDDEGKRGHEERFPPEEAQDAAARLPGKVRQVQWRALPPEATVLGFAHLGAALRPNREVVAYALASVVAPRAERVRMHFGASGAAKVWVNGALVLSDPTYHPARLDQLAAAVSLRKGVNRILVKLAHQQGPMGFHLRAVRMDGEPLPLAGAAPPWPAVEAGADPAPEQLPTAVEALQARVRGAESRKAAPLERARLQRDLALVLQWRRTGDDRERLASEAAREAARLAPSWADAQRLAGRLEEDVNRRRDLLEAAVRAAPRDARALSALASHHVDRADPARAVPLLRRALAASPAFVQAKLLLADAWDAAGRHARARNARIAAAAQHPHVLAAVLAGARAERAQDRLDAAIPMFRTALALRFDSTAARALLVQALLDRGALDEALARLDDAIRLDPSMLDERLRRADLLAANGRHDEAEAGFAEALRIAPEEADVLERRGQSRLRAGATREALADFHAALELRPQNPQLKELVRALEPEREQFEKPYVQDARALAAAWAAGAAGAASASPAAAGSEDAVILSDLHVTRVQRSGLSSTFTQLVVKVITQRGVDRFRSETVGYVPGRQEVRVERVRVLKPDGTAVETYGESDRSASEPWYRLYYDTRARVLSFPALAPGDVLELAVRRDDVSSENLLSDYFGEVVHLADTTRKLRTDYVLLVPESRKIHSSEPGAARVERSERAVAGGLVEHRWVARDVAAVRPEPGMPGWSEVSPFVHVSTYANWAQVSRFYWGLIREQLEPGAEVRATARRIADEVLAARGKPAGSAVAPEDELAVIRAVHAFVVTNTRYVGLEIGIHGYKPYRVDQVLERRFGDCKDKASLTHSLLRVLGIESRIVLLRMKRLGEIPAAPASLAVFNHAILNVPRHGLWLDGTATYSGTSDLPAEDRGASVLVVSPEGEPWFGKIPEARPEENVVENRVETAISQDGSAVVRGTSRIAGVDAPRYRRAYQSERDREAAFEHAFGSTFPGLRVKEVVLSDLARLEDPIDLTYAIEVPRFAGRENGRLQFQPFGMIPSYTEAWAPLSARKQDLILGEPQENRFTFRHVLPQGWTPESLPAPLRLDGPYAAAEVAFRVDGGAIVGEGKVVVKRGRVKAADYPAFRQFAAQLDRGLARPIRLVPATS
jgi:tetratricopeptide (TPR) repeat protein/transglutaminase-like putative cysteine protease